MNGASDPIRVLHVDDEPAFADTAGAFLEREDDRFEVITATTTSDGLDRLDTEDVDCVVSDYDMPDRNGIELLETVREEYGDVPFILFTGKGSEEIASDAISAGVTDYLQKEAGSDQYTVLANRIKNAVDHHRSQQALEASEARLSLFIDQSPLGVIEWNTDFELIRMNDAAEEILGYAAADLDEEPWERIVPDRDREQVAGVVEQLLEDRGGYRSTNENVTKDGQTIVCEWHNRVVTDDSGDVVAIFSQFQDVTERVERKRELQRKERRYQAIFNDPNILVGLTDPDGTVLDINQTAMEYTDAAPDEVVGAPFWETPWFKHSSEVRAKVEEWVERAASGEYVDFEADLRRPDGDPYTVEGVFRPVMDDDGEVVSLIVSDSEITEQKERERELERTNALLSTLFDTLPVGVLAEDASRNLLAVNQRLFDLFGLPGSPSEATGADCERLAAEVCDLFVDGAEFVNRTSELVTEREPVRSEELTLADGRTFERGYQPIELPDEEGHLWVYRDVTDRSEREHRLEALNETTRELMAAETHEEVCATGVDAARAVLNLDANAIHLYDDDRSALVPTAIADELRELVGEPPTFSGDDSIAWRVYERGEALALDDVHDDPDVYDGETAVHGEIYLPLGEYGILIAGSPTPEAFDERDVVLGEILAGNVATALEQVERNEQLRSRERELTRQNDRLEEFASVVSHDLRNPLNVAEGQLELAMEECDSDRLERVAHAHGRMQALIDDLLTLAREGDTPDDVTSVALATLAERCWRNVDTAAATLVVDTDLTVRADEIRLRQLFENLLRNAVEHGGETVTVTVGDADGGFYVADDGPGISPGERERVFESGYTTSQDGTGFGLSIVEQVADAHDWDVYLTEGTEGGARFEFTGVQTDPR